MGIKPIRALLRRNLGSDVRLSTLDSGVRTQLDFGARDTALATNQKFRPTGGRRTPPVGRTTRWGPQVIDTITPPPRRSQNHGRSRHATRHSDWHRRRPAGRRRPHAPHAHVHARHGRRLVVPADGRPQARREQEGLHPLWCALLLVVLHGPPVRLLALLPRPRAIPMPGQGRGLSRRMHVLLHRFVHDLPEDANNTMLVARLHVRVLLRGVWFSVSLRAVAAMAFRPTFSTHRSGT